MRLAAVEAGGTTWVVVIAVDSPDNIVERGEFDTEEPEETIQKVKDWLLERKFDSLGVSSFGPVDAKDGSPLFGYITSTPKIKWKGVDVLRMLGVYDEFKGIPYKFDTDVNAPALAEYRMHMGSHTSSSAYITVGTGVGVGLVVNGMTIKGLMHPESGHIKVYKKPGDNYQGNCIYHKNCLEGLASARTIADRANCTIKDLPHLPDSHEVWDTEAFYLAQLCVNLILIACPEHICIGGGVMNRKCLYPKIRAYVLQMLNGYVQSDFVKEENIDSYITESRWGKHAGIVGTAYLSLMAYQSKYA